MEQPYEIIDWHQEAQAIMNDVEKFVSTINLSKINQQRDDKDQKLKIYINLETKEGNKYTICLDSSGLRICSDRFDLDEEIDSGDRNGDSLKQNSKPETYETIYALLSCKSPAYRTAFSNALASKINNLKASNDEES